MELGEGQPEIGRALPTSSDSHEGIAKMATAYMREAGTAIQGMPIAERTAPKAGCLSARVVARTDMHIALATATNSFFVVTAASLGRDVQIGERLSVRCHEGRALIDDRPSRGR